MRFVSFGMMAALLSTAVYAQDTSAVEPPPTIGGVVSDVGRSVGESVREGTHKALDAARSVIGVGEASKPNNGEDGSEKPGDGAPVIVSPDFVANTTIGRVSRIGDDILILQQDQKRLNEIKTLINQVGIENAMILYPDLMAGLDTSPIAIEAQLARVKTLNELREEVAKSGISPDAASAPNAADYGPGTDLLSMRVSDSVSDLGEAPMDESADPALTREDVAAIIEEERLRHEQDQMIKKSSRSGPSEFSVSEIYGANGQMVALISDGLSTYKVRVGDEIPDSGKVRSITRESVIITKDGDSMEVRFR